MNKFIFLSYSLFLFLLTVFSYTFLDPNIFYFKSIYTGFAFNKSFIATVLYILLIILFYIFYFLFLNLIKNNKIDLKKLKYIIFITVGILFLSYPAMLSHDIFNYITTAKVLYFYNENPYIVMPIEFIGEPFLSFTRASNKIALYGPFWELISAIPYKLGFENFIITLFNFKLLMVLFYIGIILLIFKISKNIFSVAFFALNPLVIIETLVNSHNDVAMMFFALLAFWFIKRRKLFFSLFFLFLSIFIKYATVFLLPVFIYIIYRQYIQKKAVDYEKVFYFSVFLMLIIFFLSPLREEIYSWYAIWFLSFLALVPAKKFVLYSSIIFSLSLLLRYLPYMYTGTYLGFASIIKTTLTFIPSVFFSIYYGFKKKI